MISLEERHAAIADACGQMEKQVKAIRAHQTKLIQAALAVYNQLSAPIDGITAGGRETTIGRLPCHISPIHVCVYNHYAMCLPYQLEHAAGEWCEKGEARAWFASQGVVKIPPTKGRTDECLFCGQRDDREYTLVLRQRMTTALARTISVD